MELNNQQRDMLRAKVYRDVHHVPDDALVAWLVLLGHSLDEIEAFIKDFA